MKKSFIFLAASAVLVLAGCSTAKMNEALEKYKQNFQANPPVSIAELDERVNQAWETMIDEPSLLNDQIYLFLKKELAQQQSAALKTQEVNRHFAVSWGNAGRGGAALREAAYIHTLGGIESNERLPRNRPSSLLNVAIVDLTESYNVTPGKGYSHYELSRWERYCNYGKDMDKRDWAFVNKEGLHNIPSHLRARCNHPK